MTVSRTEAPTLPEASVAVLIAAHDAAETVGEAVTSALAEREVAEVVVIDDASRDGTAEAAEVAARGDPRLRVLRSHGNLGPAAARNLGIKATRAPFLAVLDADDAFLPGRFARLPATEGWDLVADDIVFLPEEAFDAGAPPEGEGLSALDLAGFVAGNLRNGPDRGELGFLKPLMRRDFLDRHGLRYNPALRLGEDFDLYARALAAGARFLVSHRTGYAARVRAGSLSGRHRTEDLAALEAAAARLLASLGPEHGARPVLARLHRQIAARHLLRAFLDAKSGAGWGAAMGLALAPPSNLPPILRGVLRDKLGAPPPPSAAPRYLLGTRGGASTARPSRA
ncbi:glycosyltransferase family 2 protein [Roseicyclus sp.]|uniref:glycosyltransferase family 2 protein n=1 Tax=Roseicyclus sp. TaxID=1914329 RepID=UPI003F9F6A8D